MRRFKMNNGSESGRLILIALLAILFISSGSAPSFAEEKEEHAYVIFEDDFEDGYAEDWTMNIPEDAPSGSRWSIELDDDNYVLSGRGHTWAEVGDLEWANYTFELKIKFVTPGGCHISFRMGVPAPRYFVQIWPEDVFLTKNYGETFLEVKHERITLNAGSWYTVKIVCIGNKIRVYIDDVLKLDYVDEENPILLGRIGFESCPDSHILFDDVKVSTTYSLYVFYLIKEAQDEITKALMIDADTSKVEETLSEAQTAFADGDLSSAEALAKEAINLAKHAPVGHVSVNELSKYSAEYHRHIVEVSGTIRDIRYEEGIYRFAVDDGTGVISVTFNGTLGEIKSDDKVTVVGIFNASIMTVTSESLMRAKPPFEGLYTFLIFKDDFEDGDFSDWRVNVNPKVEGSVWKVEKEDENHILSGEGECIIETGNIDWANYILELKFKIIKGDAIIFFRTSEKPPYGADTYLIRLSSYYKSVLVKAYIYLKEQRHKELKFLDLNLNPNEWYTMKIFCLENNIKIYLNDELKLEYTDEDNPYLSGSIGIAATLYGNNEPSHIHFDDIKVSKIATTADINDLIDYAQSEINKAKEINADVQAAELKLEQAKRAVTQEDYKMAQYLVDEAVWLAKRSSIGHISIRDLKASSTKISGHTVMIKGTVKDLKARDGTGYNFALDDGTDGISVTYQGLLTDIKNEYVVEVTGVFDAPSETVTASKIEKISGPITQPQAGITLSIEEIATLISIGGTIVGVAGYIARTLSAKRRRKILFKNLMDEIDEIYSRFKMNARRCEAELYKLRDQILDAFKEGTLDEDNYKVLSKRLEEYMKEIKGQIESETT